MWVTGARSTHHEYCTRATRGAYAASLSHFPSAPLRPAPPLALIPSVLLSPLLFRLSSIAFPLCLSAVSLLLVSILSPILSDLYSNTSLRLSVSSPLLYLLGLSCISPSLISPSLVSPLLSSLLSPLLSPLSLLLLNFHLTSFLPSSTFSPLSLSLFFSSSFLPPFPSPPLSVPPLPSLSFYRCLERSKISTTYFIYE